MTVKRGSWRRWKQIFIAVYLVLGLVGLRHYIIWQSSAFVIAALTLLYTPSFDKQPTTHVRFGCMAVLFSAAFALLPVMTILYLALACAILQFYETFYRRVEFTIPITMLLVMPVLEYFLQLFGFPIRLQLTALAGHLIRLAGQRVEISGNLLNWQGHNFSVDPACMGLHSLVASLLTALLVMNYYQSRYRRRLQPALVLLLLGMVTFLNIVANLLRIICLVFLVILPDNSMHGFMGLLLLIIYVLLPTVALIRRVILRWAPIVEESTGPVRPVRSQRLLAGNWLVGTCVSIAVGASLLREFRPIASRTETSMVEGYKMKRLAGSVLQLDNGQSLIYIKPIPGFYYTEHSPMICWEGSGYLFSRLQQRLLHGHRIYEGILVKGPSGVNASQTPYPVKPAGENKEVLYTAWWYDNGIRQTAGTLDWRWDVLRGGHPYSIVNITAASLQLLEKEVGRALDQHPFRELIITQGVQ